MRVIAGTLAFIVIFFALGWWPKVFKAVRNGPAMGFTTAGAFLGPFLGVGLSLLALHYTSSGVAATFIALVPIFLIPFAIFVHKEHVSVRAVLGALVAFAGVTLLMVGA